MCVYEVNLIGIISPLLNIYICMYLLYDILIYIIHTNLFFPNLMCEMIECHVLIVLVVMLTLVDNTNAMANNRIILLRMLQQLLTCALAVWSIIFAQYTFVTTASRALLTSTVTCLQDIMATFVRFFSSKYTLLNLWANIKIEQIAFTCAHSLMY